MKILEIKWKNFGSYGNEEQHLIINEKSSINLLFGSNGAGKSTLRNVLEYNIYGKVSDKKPKELINRLTQKSLETYVKIDVNGHIIEITRNLVPAKFEILIDGNADINKLAGKRNVQEYIEDELLKIPFYVFTNIISLSINDFKSFIKMTPRDKRNIIDQIFGISIVNEMLELLKVEIKSSKEKSMILITQMRSINEQIINMTDELNNLREVINNNDEEKKKRIKLKMKKYKKLKSSLDESYNETTHLYKEQRKILEDLRNKRQKIDNALYAINEKIELYNNAKCPLCMSDLHDDMHKSMLAELQKTQTNYKKAIKKIDIDSETVLEELKNIEVSANQIQEKINDIITNYKILQNELSAFGDDDTEELKSIIRLIDTNKEEIEKKNNDKQIIDNELAFYDIISTMLGENGIKRTAINTVLPMINSTINTVLSELYLDFKLYFDDKFESIITHMNKEVPHSSLSTGEMKKLDFAVIIAIIRLMKIKFPGLNILFLDEIFASLDTNTSDNILNILKNMTQEMNIHIFVVNHAIFDTSEFDNIYLANKKNGFTTLEIISNE